MMIQNRIHAFLKDETGTTLVEFAIVVSLFLLVVFAVLDFARLGYTWVTAEKAMQLTARTAAVRPAVCPGVPLIHQRGSGGADLYPSGTLCRTSGGICAAPAQTPTCTLDGPFDGAAGQATADEIWNRISPLLSDDVERSNIRLTYAHDQQLGFVGGPYIPMITAEMVDSSACGPNGNQVCFQFVTPLSALASIASPANASTDVLPPGGTIPFPNISATIPGEDLNQGTAG